MVLFIGDGKWYLEKIRIGFIFLVKSELWVFLAKIVDGVKYAYIQL